MTIIKSIILSLLFFVFTSISKGQSYKMNPIIKDKLPEYVERLPKRIYKKYFKENTVCFVDSNARDTIRYRFETIEPTWEYVSNYIISSIGEQKVLVSPDRIDLITYAYQKDLPVIIYYIKQEGEEKYLIFKLMHVKRICCIYVDELSHYKEIKFKHRFVEKFKI